MKFQDYIRNSVDYLDALREDGAFLTSLETATSALIQAVTQNKMILICGNGGSAADADHFTTELVCRLHQNRRAVKAVALGTAAGLNTAISNDLGYTQVFSRQVEALGEENGIFIGISTSGKSPNVLEAFKMAKEKGMTTIALIGSHGETFAPYSDITLSVHTGTTSFYVQQAHLCIYHYLCYQVETHLLKMTPMDDLAWQGHKVTI